VRPRRALLLLFAALAAAIPALADGPVLHEYIEANPQEDLALSATTLDGEMPAAIDTPSGVVSAPGVERRATENAYGGGSTPDSVDASYKIDRDTTRPEVVGYDDPFTPSITPFKREYAYDTVDYSLELAVADKTLEALPIGGKADFRDDQFYADLFVDLAENTPVRIPSVGPGARVLVAQTHPPLKFTLLRDGAENWFIRAGTRTRVRLVMQLAIPRDVFGSAFDDASWERLARFVPQLPESVRKASERVLGQLGMAPRTVRPREAVMSLVSHFRSFAPSAELPHAASGGALYEELALSRKGVCRHRAYAFVITALALGLPSRMVRNEAHAWVEVYDGKLWHRIDLGGAADRLQFEQAPAGQQHQPPGDPYSWPDGSQSGSDLADRAFGSQPGAASSAAPASSSSTLGTSPPPAPLADPEADTKSHEGEKPSSTLTLELREAEVRRGAPLTVAGSVSADGEPCAHARVDVLLRPSGGRTSAIGALPADDKGHFQGTVTVPLGLEVGDYDVSVTTPGTARCGAGRSRDAKAKGEP